MLPSAPIAGLTMFACLISSHVSSAVDAATAELRSGGFRAARPPQFARSNARQNPRNFSGGTARTRRLDLRSLILLMSLSAKIAAKAHAPTNRPEKTARNQFWIIPDLVSICERLTSTAARGPASVNRRASCSSPALHRSRSAMRRISADTIACCSNDNCAYLAAMSVRVVSSLRDAAVIRRNLSIGSS
ncbi:hypothetical protein GA0061098_1007283 [Bradyrhizobium shewense]|uniref:Secreted protein n=1 Tax=Bradyrhizobium shewense TaxID=1761772 RepID=A0A1C3WEQ5_9BRAD|nr:hypothetical protein GA0061098_1007283 [Bradyrhizobium shewense]